MDFAALKQFFQTLSAGIGNEIFTSVIVFVMMTVLLAAANTFIKRQDWPADVKRARIALLRNWIFILTLLLIVFTWRGEIKTFVFSISAITVGVMVAFKEIIFSFAASFAISSNRLVSIGDFVEIDGVKGRVIDRNLLMVSIMVEEGGQSGRVMMLSNMLLFNSKIINASRYGSYGMHPLEVSLKNTEDPIAACEKLYQVIEKTTKNYSDAAQTEASRISHAELLLLPAWTASVNIDIHETDKHKLVARYCSPLGKEHEVEKKIIQDYLKATTN